MSRKKLLVVAPALPDFDRQAGSRRLYAWLQILATEYEIAFYMRHRSIGDDSTRYAEALRALGIGVHPPQETTLAHLIRRIDHGVLFEFFHAAEHLLPRLRLLRPDLPMVISCADLHYVRESRAAAYADYPLIAKAMARRTRARELRTYAQADMVVTLTEHDRQMLLRVAPQTAITVVPSTFPAARDVPGFAQRIPRSILFVGGFRHPPNVDAMLFFCRQVLPLVRHALGDVTMTIVGYAPPPEVVALSSPEITVTGWAPEIEPYLASHCVSIAPLRFGSGLKGKIAEAMAAGLPVVTTGVGAEGMDLVHGTTALIAESPEAFARAVAQLCTDRDLHARLSRNSLEHATARWDPSVVAPRLLETVARLPTLQPKRLTCVDRVLVRGRAAYESTGLPVRLKRLGSLLGWYCTRLLSRLAPRDGS